MKIRYLLLLLPIVLSVLFFTLFIGNNDLQRTPPRAHQGVIDLSGWDLTKDGSLNLNGEWEFYWRQLLGPDDFASDDKPKITGYFSVPGIWNNFEVHDQSLPGDGFATFRLKMKMSPDEAIKAIRIKSLSTAYSLFINGKKIAQNGVVGRDKESTVPQFLLQEKSFFDNSAALDVILQMANFNHRRGGISHPITFGAAEKLQSSHNQQWLFDIALFGCLFVMGIYYLSIFALNRQDWPPLFLAVLILNFALRILVTDNYYLTQIFSDMSWELLYKIELSTIIIGPSFILLFINSLFGTKKRPYFQYGLIGCMLFFFVVTLLSPAAVSSHLVLPCQVIILSIFSCSLIILLKSLKTDPRKAGVMLLGFSVLTATAVADILNANQVFYFSFLVHFGILFLISSQSFVMSLRYSGVFKDIRLLSVELKDKNIELQRLDKLKDEFLANTTHELRTPLNGMVGMAESMINEVGKSLSSQAAGNLKTIIASGKRLANLINDVQDFSRLKNKDVTLNCVPVDIRSLTNVVLSVLRPLVGNKPLELINDMSTDTPAIHGDEDRLQQVLYNLVGNAIKFTNTGSVTVSASVCEGFVEVAVKDTGLGISPDRLEDIFAAYEQDNIDLKKGYGGTGLGLTIVEKLVMLHGGTVRAVSSLGQGSCFTFSIPVSEHDGAVAGGLGATLPAVTNLNPSAGDIPPVSGLMDTGLHGESVLVVDDDPVNLQVVANHLSAASIHFTTASDGLDALTMIDKRGAPAMILLDIMMPNMDGYEVCRRLRERFSPAELPIVLLTARNSIEDLVQGFKVGGSDYLTKPFSSDELLARVRTHLKIKEAYETMQENLRLRKEVDLRRQTEKNLKLTQRRLSRMLDTVKEAVLAVNESHEICYCNKNFETMTRHQGESLLGKPLSSILVSDGNNPNHTIEIFDGNVADKESKRTYDVSFSCPDRSTLSVQLQVTVLDFDNELLFMLVAHQNHMQSGKEVHHESRYLAVAAIDELNRNLTRLRKLENSLSWLTSQDLKENSPLVRELQSMDDILANLAQYLDHDLEMQDKRLLAVTLMNQTLDYWQSATGLDKAALARQSELWKVYMDHNGWERTQTLDKYLDIKQLPNRPRWKIIIRTADFVLTECDLESPLREEIESTLRQLKVQV